MVKVRQLAESMIGNDQAARPGATSAEDGFELVECAPGLRVGLMRPDRGGGIIVQPLFDSIAGQAFAVLPERFEGVSVELGGNQDSVPSHHPRRATGGRGRRRPRVPCSRRSTLPGGRVRNRPLCRVRQGFGLFEPRTLHWVEACHRDRHD